MPNKTPIGWLDGISNGYAHGWALDPDDPSVSIAVHFYIDGPAGSGTLAGGILANLARPDVNAVTRYPDNHGFSFSIPAPWRDGRQHTLFVHGIDFSGTLGANVLLLGVPQTFLLAAPVPPSPPVIPSLLWVRRLRAPMCTIMDQLSFATAPSIVCIGVAFRRMAAETRSCPRFLKMEKFGQIFSACLRPSFFERDNAGRRPCVRSLRSKSRDNVWKKKGFVVFNPENRKKYLKNQKKYIFGEAAPASFYYIITNYFKKKRKGGRGLDSSFSLDYIKV